jgi:hypothetical protein
VTTIFQPHSKIDFVCVLLLYADQWIPLLLHFGLSPLVKDSYQDEKTGCGIWKTDGKAGRRIFWYASDGTAA